MILDKLDFVFDISNYAAKPSLCYQINYDLILPFSLQALIS